jgi:predicted metal-binding protein
LGKAVTNFCHPVLHVCITCAAGNTALEPQDRPGQRLFEALTAMATNPLVEILPVSCLAACEKGCTATIFMPGKKFGYLLGHLAPDLATDLLAYTQSYAASPTGAVMPSRRAASLQNAVLSRFPAYGLLPETPQPKDMA